MSIYLELNKALRNVKISVDDINSLEDLTISVSKGRITKKMLHKSFK